MENRETFVVQGTRCWRGATVHPAQLRCGWACSSLHLAKVLDPRPSSHSNGSNNNKWSWYSVANSGKGHNVFFTESLANLLQITAKWSKGILLQDVGFFNPRAKWALAAQEDQLQSSTFKNTLHSDQYDRLYTIAIQWSQLILAARLPLPTHVQR